MQLLVFPSQSHTIHFKVVDEFGTRFEVTNCSICLHWIMSGEKGEVIFSAGYNGCHVLRQDGCNHLRVRVEELLSTGAIAATHDVNMSCPKPTEHDLTPAAAGPGAPHLSSTKQHRCPSHRGAVPCGGWEDSLCRCPRPSCLLPGWLLL
ncbi:zona pellucida sperm-binding protein 1-like [Dermochelys coriacea]|uniref:zona pellucida sperm-binding protein 1-like n=1 Tax=Dermochelys coriacea TaxID=27794 RepID=UPI001CAA1BFB|nr:zona pellucida sperm-binding protein 1-like [Dermochelys coriacea]